MRGHVRLSILTLAMMTGCATHSGDQPSPRPPSTPGAQPSPTPRNCAADVATLENTSTRMAFRVENKSVSAKTGTIRELRLLFTPARCPVTVEGPAGWTGSIDAQAPRHFCEVAWVTKSENGVPVGTKMDGFAVTFKRGKKETPSWAVFLEGCAVGGPGTSRPR